MFGRYVVCAEVKSDYIHEWEQRFFGYDCYSGGKSTGCPYWYSWLSYAKMFKTVEEAEKEYKENEKRLIGSPFSVKPNTLCIKKIVLEDVKSL